MTFENNLSDIRIKFENKQHVKYFYLLLLTLNVPLRIGKCTIRGTCTPCWEPLVYSICSLATTTASTENARNSKKFSFELQMTFFQKFSAKSTNFQDSNHGLELQFSSLPFCDEVSAFRSRAHLC